MAADAFIQCRVSAATKGALRSAAQRQQLTESALVKRLIEVMLQTAGATNLGAVAPGAAGRVARLYVRLTSDDWALLRGRAAARTMAPATYASMLLRAHLRSLSPLPKGELLALKQSIAELGAIGRNLNQIARIGHQSGRLTGPGREDLRAILKVCEGLRDHVRGLLRANVTSWQVGHADQDN